jgi:hypothetical protein
MFLDSSTLKPRCSVLDTWIYFAGADRSVISIEDQSGPIGWRLAAARRSPLVHLDCDSAACSCLIRTRRIPLSRWSRGSIHLPDYQSGKVSGERDRHHDKGNQHCRIRPAVSDRDGTQLIRAARHSVSRRTESARYRALSEMSRRHQPPFQEI